MGKILVKLNLYMCEHGCHNVTVDVDKGVTPFMIGCEFTGRPDRIPDPTKMKYGKCIGMAKSCMYPKEIDDKYPIPVATHEWYRPSLKEFKTLSELEKDYVKDGGLLMRKRTEAIPLLHAYVWSYEDEDFKKEIGVFYD